MMATTSTTELQFRLSLVLHSVFNTYLHAYICLQQISLISGHRKLWRGTVFVVCCSSSGKLAACETFRFSFRHLLRREEMMQVKQKASRKPGCRRHAGAAALIFSLLRYTHKVNSSVGKLCFNCVYLWTWSINKKWFFLCCFMLCCCFWTQKTEIDMSQHIRLFLRNNFFNKRRQSSVVVWQMPKCLNNTCHSQSSSHQFYMCS